MLTTSNRSYGNINKYISYHFESLLSVYFNDDVYAWSRYLLLLAAGFCFLTTYEQCKEIAFDW